MAFLTTSDISTNLEAGFNSSQVDRLLLTAEQSLRRVGFVFSVPSQTTRTIEGDYTGRSVFGITPVSSISAVTRGDQVGNIHNTISLGFDYLKRSHRNIPTYSIQIELVNSPIYSNNVINITGLWGIYIDFTATDNFEQKLLRAGIIDWIRLMLDQYSASSNVAQNVQSASTGESRVAFFAKSLSDFDWDITQQPNFQSTLEYFYG